MSSEEDARFKAWLLETGFSVATVKGDPKWNATVARTTAEKITKKDKK